MTPTGQAGSGWRRPLLWVGGAFVILVGGAAAIAISPSLQASRWARTRMDIRDLQSTLQEYARTTGHFPGTAEGFRPLLATGAILGEPHDAWGRPFHYTLVEGLPEIISFGSDGRPGGAGPDEDISTLSPELFRTEFRTR